MDPVKKPTLRHQASKISPFVENAAPAVAPAVAPGAATKAPRKARVPKSAEIVTEAQTSVSAEPIIKKSNKVIVQEELVKLCAKRDALVQLTKASSGVPTECKQFLSELADHIAIIKKKGLRRESKKPTTEPRRVPTQSGITKPIEIVPEMSKFAGWPVGELHSRVEMSTAIFKYIADNKLQRPEARSYIIPDQKLRDLLKYNEETDGPLRYTKIQGLIGRVIVKKPTV